MIRDYVRRGNGVRRVCWSRRVAPPRSWRPRRRNEEPPAIADRRSREAASSAPRVRAHRDALAPPGQEAEGGKEQEGAAGGGGAAGLAAADQVGRGRAVG